MHGIIIYRKSLLFNVYLNIQIGLDGNELSWDNYNGEPDTGSENLLKSEIIIKTPVQDTGVFMCEEATGLSRG